MPTSRTGPTGDQRISQRIQAASERLTDGERRLADVILVLETSLSGFTAAELAARAGVSPATAARFFRRLGYANYGETRRQVLDELAVGSPLHELTRGATPAGDDLRAHVEKDIQNLASLLDTLDAQDLRTAIDILSRSATSWVLGFRNSMALAEYARGVLLHVKPDIRLLPAAGMTISEEAASFSPRQALLAIGFRRRLPVFSQVLAEASAVGMPTVLITDAAAPFSKQDATVILRCQARGQSYFDSYAAAMSLLNYIATSVGLALGSTAMARLRRIERLHTVFHPGIEGGSRSAGP